MSLRIGLVTTSYPRESGDPAGSFVAAHVAAMRLLGHDVEVITARDIGSPLFEGSGAPEELERGGLLDQAKAMLEGARFTADLTTAVYKRIHDWDLVVAHWLPCAVAAVTARQALRAAKPSTPRKPILAIAHGGDVHTLRRTFLLAPTMKTLEVAGVKVAFVSDELRQLAGADKAGVRAIVQPMGVNVERFADLARTPTTPPTIAVIGRLVPIKGVDVAIDAMTHVSTPARLEIAGDGPERAALEQRAEKIRSDLNSSAQEIRSDLNSSAQEIRSDLNSSARISFLGQLNADARDELLGRASLVVIPSRVLPNGRSEGTPLVALEALASGVPVIASDVGGLRELANDNPRGSGDEPSHPFREQPSLVTLVPPDDPRALAAAIDRVLANPPPSDRLRASVEQLDWSRVAQRLLDFALA
jgi:glycosyltransferase involved in cell wall biosynthesis